MGFIRARLIKFISEEEGENFIIAKMKAIDEKGKAEIKQVTGNDDGYFTIKGRSFFKPVVDDLVCVDGRWASDEKYGDQMIINNCLPAATVMGTKANLFEMMSSELFKSIDLEILQNLRLKYKTSNELGKALIEDPSKALNGTGFNPDNMALFKRQFETARTMAQDYAVIRKMGYSVDCASRLISKGYIASGAAISMVSKNPFGLIDMESLDSVNAYCKEYEIFSDPAVKSNAILMAAKNELVNNGSTCATKEEIIEHAISKFKADKESFIDNLDSQIHADKINMVKIGDETIYVDNRFYRVEKEAAELFTNFVLSPWDKVDTKDIKPKETYLNKEQISAVSGTLNSKFSIISGGPGTGKTTVTKSVIDCLRRAYGRGLKISCVAPTGKAANRMAESTGEKCNTIHSLLKYNKATGFDEDNPPLIDSDVIIVDEASMLDIIVFRNLLKSVKPTSRIIFVGDVDQLPSVECGDVLNDLIATGKIEVNYLVENNRVDKTGDRKSTIVENAKLINNGEMPPLAQNRHGDFHFIPSDNDSDIVNKIMSMCTKYIPKELGMPYEDVQILSPQIETEVGVNAFNEKLREVFNPNYGQFQANFYGRDFRVDDRVIQTQTDHKLKITNGSIGRIMKIDLRNKFVEVDFGYMQPKIPLGKMKNLELAYSKTIHKSQGSEYGAVIIPISKSNNRMLNRKLIYTAITRAKKHVFLVGDPETLERALSDERQMSRSTAFTKMVKAKLENNLELTSNLSI